MATRGMWNVPRRNKLFVGRERELSELHSKMHAEDAELTSGVTALGTVGLGARRLSLSLSLSLSAQPADN